MFFPSPPLRVATSHTLLSPLLVGHTQLDPTSTLEGQEEVSGGDGLEGNRDEALRLDNKSGLQS